MYYHVLGNGYVPVDGNGDNDNDEDINNEDNNDIDDDSDVGFNEVLREPIVQVNEVVNRSSGSSGINGDINRSSDPDHRHDVENDASKYD